MTRSVTALPARPNRVAALVRGVLSISVFLALWELTLRLFSVSELLVPRPLTVLDALVTSIQRVPLGRGSLASAAWSSYSAAIIAFVLAGVVGVVIALALSEWPGLERTVAPYIVAFQTLPRIAIAPLFLIWFGQGRVPKVLLAALVAFFPVMVNALAGFKSTPSEWIEWLRSHHASSWQIFRHAKLHSALPYVFAGLEVALVFSILGVVVTEFVGASDGLGVLILQSHYAIDVAGVFAVFIVLVVVGLLLRLLVTSVRSRLLFWSVHADVDAT